MMSSIWVLLDNDLTSHIILPFCRYRRILVSSLLLFCLLFPSLHYTRCQNILVSCQKAPEAFGGLSTALSVPTWCFNVWALAAVAQLASVAKSALSSDRDELSQSDITAGAVSNWAAARMVGSANPLRDTIVAAVVSGYALRNNNADGAVNVHNASTQLIASFTTLAILGTISAAVARIAFLQDIPQVTTLLGVAAMYVINARAGNGTVKKAVNSGMIAGILYNRLLQGVSFAANGASIMSNLALLAMATVATDSLNNLRKAVFN